MEGRVRVRGRVGLEEEKERINYLNSVKKTIYINLHVPGS